MTRILAVGFILLLTAPDSATSAAWQAQPSPQDRAQQLQARLAEAEKTAGSDDPAVATALNDLAVFYFQQGDFPAAEPLFRRALTIREKTLGADHALTAQSLNNLALVLQERGGYPEAQPLLERALALNEKSRGPDHPEVAAALNNLAALHRLTGNYAKAEPLYQRALAINEKANGAEHSSVAIVLNNLGLTFQQQGDLEKARPLLERSLAIREKIAGPDHPDVARALNNLAVVMQERGDLATAEKLYRRAVEIYEKSLGRAHQFYGQTLNNLAVVHLVKGEHSVAGPMYEEALKVRSAALGPAHPEMTIALTSHAIYYDVVGNIAEAVKRQSESANVTERNLDLILASGSETQKTRYMETFTENTDITVSMHRVSAPDDSAARSLALTTLLRRKGRVLDAIGGALNALRGRMSEEDRAALDRLAAARTQLARLVLRGPGRQDPAAFGRDVVAAEEHLQKAERDLSERSAAYRAQVLPVTIDSVKGALPAGAALVEIAVYRPFNNRVPQRDKRFGVPRYVAYVVRPGVEPAAVDLGDVTTIDPQVDTLRRSLSNTKSPGLPAAARALYASLVKPIVPLLGDARRVFISPDGALNLVPFAALQDENGRYLVESHEISYLTSGRDLIRLRERAPESRRALIVANPDFGTPAGSPGGTDAPAARTIDLSRARFTPLPGTAAEATALGELIPGAEVRTGREATEATLRGVRGPRVLHLATHGFFLGGNDGSSAASRSLVHDAAARDSLSASVNPLLRSGLAFAGANARRGAEEDDGILTALEAASLDLWGTRMAVLSACETGVGETRRGDGVYGLRRALVVAGAESQVMSLWQVSDEGTRALMTDFYTKLKAGADRSAALRAVQLEMLRSSSRKHPYYWASFILSGADGPIALQ
jgi:CHAT domain-containing protein/tetratricopeptide (TPR) repeat protein